MPDDINIQTEQSQATPEQQTERREARLPEISDLKQFREREASSANAQGQAKEGQPAQQGEQREQYIPRERFDQVNQRMQTAEQQAQQMQAMLQQFMLQQQAQRVPPQQHPGGMANTAPAPQPAPSGPALPDFSDPKVAKEWQNKIANGGVTELVGLIQQVVQATGQPLLQQLEQKFTQQLTPLQRSFISQAAEQYSSARSQQDPTFQQVRPYFERYLQEAVQRNPDLQLNSATLSTIEHVAKLQAQQEQAQYGGFNPYMQQPQYQPQQPAPFTERPGAAASMGQARQSVHLTPQQRAAAKGFGMTEEQYAQRLREMNIG